MHQQNRELQINSLMSSLTKLLEHPLFRTLTLTLTIITSVLTIIGPQGFRLPESTFLRFVFLVLSATFFGLFIAPQFFKPKIPIYEYRLKFMRYYLTKFIRESKETVKILNILATWLEHLEEEIRNKIIKDDVYFEILLLKRRRKKDDMSYFSLRESDEDRYEELVRGLNKTLFSVFRFLISLASESKKDGSSFIHKLQLKEYAFLPVICEYIFDEKILVFGPYIAKNCNFIPLVQLEKNIKSPLDGISTAFDELLDHYKILSEPERRLDKEYIEFFSFFDGTDNKSIHEFIEHDYKKIDAILSENSKKYLEYLDGKIDDFNDQYVEAIGKNNLEGRFDAVIRDIKNQIDQQSTLH